MENTVYVVYNKINKSYKLPFTHPDSITGAVVAIIDEYEPLLNISSKLLWCNIMHYNRSFPIEWESP